MPGDTVKELAHIHVFNAGLQRLVRHAHPEKDLEHVMNITGSVDLLPDNSKEHAILLKGAFRYHVKDPLVLLKQAGIDIEPELEEFRQFLAEISGKKVEPKKGRRATEIPKSSGNSWGARLEVLSILNSLEFSGFSEETKRKALEKLSSRIAELSKENLPKEFSSNWAPTPTLSRP